MHEANSSAEDSSSLSVSHISHTIGTYSSGLRFWQSHNDNELPSVAHAEITVSPSTQVVEDDQSLAQWRPRHTIVLPSLYQYQNNLPAVLPLVPSSSEATKAPPMTPQLESSSQTMSSSFILQVSDFFKTPVNTFGLWWIYSTQKPPTHDPEQHVTLENVVNYGIQQDQSTTPDLGPYPNESSYLLSQWYWSHGAQKSKGNFQDLSSIVGSSEFKPEDVANTPWCQIDAELTMNPFDNDHHEWMDVEAGWHRKPVKISIPFHNWTQQPSVEEFYLGNFYYQSLVEVIKAKLTNPVHHTRFHYEPFELWWMPSGASSSTRVHGELYTSPAFIESYKAVLESPNKPGCTLEQVVFAMMFTSDETLLTNFGDAKLWPGYLYSGNDSKYVCCQSSSNCCEHVAYFWVVSSFFWPCSVYRWADHGWWIASWHVQRFCLATHWKVST